MRKLLSLLIAVSCIATVARAQRNGYAPQPWSLELNVFGGELQQKLYHEDITAAYPDALNSKVSDIKSIGKYAAGGALSIGYFFGPGHHLGIGAGLQYLQQAADISLSTFHVEYRSLDYNNDTFRQVLTNAEPVKEKVTTTNISIPLVLKWQTQFSEKTGLTLDAGVLYSLSVSGKYTTGNNAFDYGAIYKFGVADDIGKPVYDNAPIPDPNDWVLTSAGYSDEQINQFRNRGYNVGAAVRTGERTGGVSYKTGAVGLLVRPSLTFCLSRHMSLQAGAYFMMQAFKRNAATAYMVTDKTGEYKSLTEPVTKTNNTSYGVSLGIRYAFGKPKDSDGDGIPDRKDECPYQAGTLKGCPDTDKDGIADPYDSCRKAAGSARYHGCPDTDGDGIIDKDDHCPRVAGLAALHGCPAIDTTDTDGDGIVDKKDDCPDIAGTLAAHGCPDADGDGVIDKKDECPDIAGTLAANGCPDRDGDGIADKYDACPDIAGRNNGCPYDTMMTEQTGGGYVPSHIVMRKNTINFDLGGSVLENTAYTILDEAVAALNKDPRVIIFVCGFTDDIGTDVSNLVLSVERAEVVNKYLLSKGIPQERIIISGYGKKAPIAENNSPENRAKNRRTEMRLLLPLE